LRKAIRDFAPLRRPEQLPSGGKANVGSTTNAFSAYAHGTAAPHISIQRSIRLRLGEFGGRRGCEQRGRCSAAPRPICGSALLSAPTTGLNEDGEKNGIRRMLRSEVLESTQTRFRSGRYDRVIVTPGGFAVGDVFDDNVYAHDPRPAFNFAFNMMGVSDYAADAWGYTYGLRLNGSRIGGEGGGVFQLPTVPMA
jgi:high affinity Mn2+ porin